MRIIAGDKARHPLLPPKDRTTRPITDRVKESLFNILRDRLEGARVADLFCGTGSLGLEALSRGAAIASMIDRDRDAIRRLKINIAKCGFEGRSCVWLGDAFKAGRHLAGKFDIVFIDPPYPLSRNTNGDSSLGKLLLDSEDFVTRRSVLIVRHESRVSLLDSYGGISTTDCREYGNMAISFLEPQSHETE